MKEPALNAHNKEEFLPAHTDDFNSSSIKMYSTEDGKLNLEVKLEKDTVWLNQSQIAELFDVDRTSVLRHIHNIYKDGELEENSTCAKIAQVRKEGTRVVSRELPYYNLDMIISVGYRINSKKATSFRTWATQVAYLLEDECKEIF